MSDAPAVAAALERFRNPASRAAPAFGLDHIRRALARLGDPQDSAPTAIHITGTNGKGSTGAFIRAMAEASGLSAHVFTSPHLVAANERIRIAGRLASDDELAATLIHIAENTEGLTYFEALTAAAFVLFARYPADISIIEVGAGGATDATNVMSRPAATVITPISRDHEIMFGVSGVAAIARLKAGIFRRRVPAVLAEQPPSALDALREEASAIGAPLHSAHQHWKAAWRDGAFVFGGKHVQVRAPWLALPGAHQSENAGAACAAVEMLQDPRFTPETMAAGLREAHWPARLQKLSDGPLTRNQTSEIFIDAAHNPAGAAALAAAIRVARRPGDRVAVIIAMQGAKDAEGMLAELASPDKGVADDIIACELPDSGGQEGGPGAAPAHLAAIARTLGAHALEAQDYLDALKLAQASGAARIYVCGSLYLCGALLSANGERVE